MLYKSVTIPMENVLLALLLKLIMLRNILAKQASSDVPAPLPHGLNTQNDE